MDKTATATMVALAALGTACAVAYGCMRPQAKQQLKKDVQSTLSDISGVKEEVLNVGQDVSELARNLKNQM